MHRFAFVALMRGEKGMWNGCIEMPFQICRQDFLVACLVALESVSHGAWQRTLLDCESCVVQGAVASEGLGPRPATRPVYMRVWVGEA